MAVTGPQPKDTGVCWAGNRRKDSLVCEEQTPATFVELCVCLSPHPGESWDQQVLRAVWVITPRGMQMQS